jgi:hypothetical protein
MAIVTAGQITIIDQNDARPINALIRVAPGAQQTYSKEDSSDAYSPDWTTQNGGLGLRLTVKVYVGGVGAANEVSGQMTGRKFMLEEDGAAITGTAALISSNASMAAAFVSGAGLTYTVTHNNTGSVMFIKSNMLETVPNQIVYFEGDYTDSVTGLTTKVGCHINLSVVKTGTNATYVLTTGKKTIKKSDGTTKNVGVVKANLVRPVGIDTSGLEFRWYENNGATQISTSSAAGMYALKNIAEGAAVVASVSDLSTPNLPAAGSWTTLAGGGNTLVIHEDAVFDLGVYRVEIRDTANSNVIHQAFFTVTDFTDPYRLDVDSSSGDKLNNGEGSTLLTPRVYRGGSEIASYSGWEFVWTPWQRTGKRAAFIDASRTAYGAGRTVTAHTTGTTATITYSGTAFTTPAIVTGDIIKVVSTSGQEAYYEVASVSGATITIRTGTTNNWLNFTDYPAPVANQFLNGKFFVCTVADGAAARGQRRTTGQTAITLTGDDVDAKMRVTVSGNRP